MSVFFHDAFFDHVLEIFWSEKCAVLLNCLVCWLNKKISFFSALQYWKWGLFFTVLHCYKYSWFKCPKDWFWYWCIFSKKHMFWMLFFQKKTSCLALPLFLGIFSINILTNKLCNFRKFVNCKGWVRKEFIVCWIQKNKNML